MDRLLSRVLLLLAALVALPAAAADANWWQAEWKYRKPITVDAGPQGAGLAGDPGRTPLLLRLHTGNFGFTGHAGLRRGSPGSAGRSGPAEQRQW